MPFFVFLLLLPLVEITLFIQIGDEIGLFPTLAWCMLSAALGLVMIQYQGLRAVMAAREALDKGDLPVREIFDGICFYIAGILFIIPGYATDFLAVLLCVPPFRTWLQEKLGRYFIGAPVQFRTRRTWQEEEGSTQDIDVEYTHVDEDPEYIEKRLEDRRSGH